MDGGLWSVYDAMGERFADHAAEGAFNAHYDRPAVLDTLGPVAGLRVLDAACGPGLYAQALVDAGADVVGFDASGAMVQLARQRLGPRARIDQARLGEELPYRDGEFDVALCALALHHVADRRAAFGELHRVVRPGGALVVSTQHPTADWLRHGGSYFDTVLETDRWTIQGERFAVPFWRQPMSAVCAEATDAGWLIERLVEPRPTEGMRAIEPAHPERLQREPGFLVLRLRKLP